MNHMLASLGILRLQHEEFRPHGLANWKANGGMRLSFATMAAFMKYLHTSNANNEKARRGKFSFFLYDKIGGRQALEEVGLDVSEGENGSLQASRHPISYIVEAADDACYITTDLEDAYRMYRDPNIYDALKEIAGKNVADDHFGLNDENDKSAYIRSKSIDRLIEYVCSELTNNRDGVLRGISGPIISYDGTTPMGKTLKRAREKCKELYVHPEN